MQDAEVTKSLGFIYIYICMYIASFFYNFVPPCRWEWSEGLFDCSWSEHNPDFNVTASGDGSLQVWDLKNPKVNIILKFFIR